FATLQLMTVCAEDTEIPTRHRLGRGTMLHRKLLEPDTVGCDRPAGLGLPPMIDDGHRELALGPFDGRRIGAFAGEEKRAELRHRVLADEPTVRIFALDGAERRRRGEHHRDAVLSN